MFSMRLVAFFVFFQAEDGIRDGHVTGVQTCALPISGTAGAADRDAHCGPGARRPGTGPDPRRRFRVGRPGARRAPADRRSEERRVGKEWRMLLAKGEWKYKENENRRVESIK